MYCRFIRFVFLFKIFGFYFILFYK